MSAPTNDGGPAFPLDPRMLRPDSTCEQIKAAQGMTLRDYFAARVLDAYLSLGKTSTALGDNVITPLDLAGACYEWADLMLIARERKEDRS